MEDSTQKKKIRNVYVNPDYKTRTRALPFVVYFTDGTWSECTGELLRLHNYPEPLA